MPAWRTSRRHGQTGAELAPPTHGTAMPSGGTIVPAVGMDIPWAGMIMPSLPLLSRDEFLVMP